MILLFPLFVLVVVVVAVVVEVVVVVVVVVVMFGCHSLSNATCPIRYGLVWFMRLSSGQTGNCGQTVATYCNMWQQVRT